MSKRETIYGHGCPDCKKAMFYLEDIPKLGQPIEYSKMIVRSGAKRPSHEYGYECQFCGAKWVRMFLNRKFMGEFDVKTGDQISWLK